MIDALTETLASGLSLVLVAAWRALPLVAIALLLGPVLRLRVPARCHCWLWMLVVVRLLLPSSIASPLSLAAPADRALEQFFTTAPEKYPRNADSGRHLVVSQNEEQYFFPASVHGIADEEPLWATAAYQSDLAPYPVGESDPKSVASLSRVDWQLVAFYVVIWTWALVAFGLLLRSAISHLRFAFDLRRMPEHEDQYIDDAVEQVRQAIGLEQRPKVKLVPWLEAPAVFGLWRPVLCWPAHSSIDLSAEELVWVLRHELSHIKRRDAILLSVAAFTCALHWFNPIAWIAQARLKSSVEQAADEVATQEMSLATVIDYGRLLLKYATAQSPSSRRALVGLLSISSARQLKRRIELLRPTVRGGAMPLKLAIIPLLGVLAIAGWTDARTPKRQQPIGELEHTFQSSLVWADIESAERLPEVEDLQPVSFDVRGPLRKLEQLQPGIDAERFLLSYLPGIVMDYPELDAATQKIATEWSATTITNETLHAALTPKRARFCRLMLKALERSGPVQISIECRILQADVACARSFNWDSNDFKPALAQNLDGGTMENLLGGPLDLDAQLPGEPPFARSISASDSTSRIGPTLTARLSEAETRALVIHCQSDPRSNIMAAPRVTLFNGMEGMIQDIVRRPFVTNVHIVKQAEHRQLEPVIQLFDEGFSMRVHVEATEDDRIDFGCTLTATSIDDVQLATLPFRSPHDPKADVIVQVPSVHRHTVGAQICIAKDSSLLIASPRSYREADDTDRSLATFYLLTPRLIPDTEDLALFVPNAAADASD